jgi:hypothetical protein
VNPEKTKYLLKPSDKKAGQGHSIKIANRSFEDVAKFKHVGTNLRGWAYGMYGRGEEIVQGLGGEFRRKEATRKIEDWD